MRTIALKRKQMTLMQMRYLHLEMIQGDSKEITFHKMHCLFICFSYDVMLIIEAKHFVLIKRFTIQIHLR